MSADRDEAAAFGRLLIEGMEEVRRAGDMGDFVSSAEYSVVFSTPDGEDWKLVVAKVSA